MQFLQNRELPQATCHGAGSTGGWGWGLDGCNWQRHRARRYNRHVLTRITPGPPPELTIDGTVA
jgi:hypothetical protein